MLVLTRRVGEEIIIANNIHITVVSVRGECVRLGIAAPPSIQVDRQEVHRRRQQSARTARELRPVHAEADLVAIGSDIDAHKE
jgi:carbon storage regulator